MLLVIIGPVSDELLLGFAFLYIFTLPTASHLHWCLTFHLLSVACYLSISDCWIFFTIGAGWILDSFSLFCMLLLNKLL